MALTNNRKPELQKIFSKLSPTKMRELLKTVGFLCKCKEQITFQNSTEILKNVLAVDFSRKNPTEKETTVAKRKQEIRRVLRSVMRDIEYMV